METVRQVLERKGSKVHSVAPDVSILDALGVMAEHDIGAVLVMDGDRLLGIFSERDYARKVVLKGLVSRDVQVSQLMTPNPRTVSPSSTVEEVMNMMTENRFRHLPVVENGRLVGIVTIGDMVKSMVMQQERTIRHLSSYIAGDLAAE
ncbi:MAG TPA: CBS domain-containing protein [Gammaproteobacteria bacterium]|nr:CBS domain-containing protein [Gammaproteobacteria bacterium]